MNEKINNTNEDREQFLQRIAQYLEVLPTDAIAELLADDECSCEILEAGSTSPALMRKVEEAFKSVLPYEIEDDLDEADRMAEELAAPWEGNVHSERTNNAQRRRNPLPSRVAAVCDRIARTLGDFGDSIASLCIGWSNPDRPFAMASSGDMELSATLERAVGGEVLLRINRFGVTHVSARFDKPETVNVFLYDLKRQKLIPFTEGTNCSPSLVLEAQTVREAHVLIPESTKRSDLELVVVKEAGL